MGLYPGTGLFQQLEQGLPFHPTAGYVCLQQPHLGAANPGNPGRHASGDALGCGLSRDTKDPSPRTYEYEGLDTQIWIIPPGQGSSKVWDEAIEHRHP